MSQEFCDQGKMDTATESETIERLEKEAESLKIRLDDERQKLNDVTRQSEFVNRFHQVYRQEISVLRLMFLFS